MGYDRWVLACLEPHRDRLYMVGCPDNLGWASHQDRPRRHYWTEIRFYEEYAAPISQY